ncbi:MAG: hypothetical protein HC836_34700 [Richelia sp. RM2_1_2]|nr:hypothetical protein [Richelia sp. RM2_1_2]
MEYAITPNVQELIDKLKSYGFEQKDGDSHLVLKVDDDLYVSAVTCHVPDSLWIQFRGKNFSYNTENSQSDNYCKTVGEIILSLADYCHERGWLAERNRVKKILGLY